MKLDNESLNFINFFERMTKTKVKDSFINNERQVIIVEEGNINKAIGPKGSNVKKIESMINKKLKIVEFSKDPVKFIRSFLFPLKPEIELNAENEIEIKSDSVTEKGLIIGKNRKNLENLKTIVAKYYNLKDIKVV